MAEASSRTVRVFLSSTFRDFGEERDLLVRRVFPSLRVRLKDRFVELVDVDLRWGITVEEAERGEVLPICLAEIDRSRPFFIGLLGERYGWVPAADIYASDLLEKQRWLDEHRGGKSVTELEILHGVLNDPAMAGRALFYFRSPDYAQAKGGEYLATSSGDAERQSELKERIRRSGFPVIEDYTDPEALAVQLEADLWAILEDMYPPDEVPDAFERERRRHEAYATPRRRLYLGGESYRSALDDALVRGVQRILIEGQSGGGKSALIANWIEAHEARYAEDLFFVHYTGASADAADPVSLARRLCEAIRRQTGSSEEVPGDPQKVLEGLPLWLANASAYASKEDRRWLIVIDALNGLTDLRDLRWFPDFLPERVHVLVSCLPGEVLQALETKGAWERVKVEPLDRRQAERLLTDYLRNFNKTLSEDLTKKAVDHPLSTNPLFLKTLAEELRLFGLHEELAQQLDQYLESQTVDDLFERVLVRVEQDCEVTSVQRVMEGIWASRAGLTEEEIRGYADLPQARWAIIRYALDEALLESGGRITFAHDYLRIAISDRYMKGNGSLEEETQSDEALELRRRAHAALAQWFQTREIDQRSAEEIPWQWRQAGEWERLKDCLTNRKMFEAICVHQTREEILAYWLDFEREAGGDMEAHYEIAWACWKPDINKKETGELAARLERVLFSSGRYKKLSLMLAELAVTIFEKALGPVNPITGEALNNLAMLLQHRGDYAKAESIYRRSLEIAEKAQGADNPETGRCLRNLAWCLRATGDYDVAENLFRQSLVISEKSLGEECAETGICLNHLASILQDKGDYAGAEPLFRRSLIILEKYKGAESRDTVSSLNNLAVLLHLRGNYASAEPLYRRTVSIFEKTLGPEHPTTSTGLNNLARLLQDKGNYGAALPLFHRALAIVNKALGSEHPSSSLYLSNLAGLLRDTGDYEGAEQLFRQALAIAEKVLGPEHPDTGERLSNLAALLQAKADYAGAEPLCRRALAIREKVLGPEHPATGTSLGSLAGLLRDTGDYEGAEQLFRQALAIAEKTQGPEHPDTGERLSHLAALLQTKGDYAGAEPLCRRALAIREKVLGPEHPATGTSLGSLAGLLRDTGDYAGAEQLFRQALAIAEKTQGPEHPSTGWCLNNLASLLQDIGDYAGAEPLFRRALVIIEKTAGTEHLATAWSLNNLASLLQDIGDYAGAEPLLRRAVVLVKNVFGEIDGSTGNLLYSLGNTLEKLGKSEEAEQCFRRELHICEEIEGSDSPFTGGSLFNLGNFLATHGRFDEAERLLRRELSISEQSQKEDLKNYLDSLVNLGVVLRQANLPVASELEFEKAIPLAEQLQNGRAFAELAELRLLQSRPEEAIQLLEHCLYIRRVKLPAEDTSILETRQRLAEVYEKQGRIDEAARTRGEISQKQQK